MLNKEYLCTRMVGLTGITTATSQILEGDGYDAIMDILNNLRGITFPCLVLEGQSSGSLQIVEGPVDIFTQSIWVMGRLGRAEDEPALYRSTFALMKEVIARLLVDSHSGSYPVLEEWDWQRITYMKRYGGPEARGWELVLTFKENISLLEE